MAAGAAADVRDLDVLFTLKEERGTVLNDFLLGLGKLNCCAPAWLGRDFSDGSQLSSEESTNRLYSSSRPLQTLSVTSLRVSPSASTKNVRR